MELRLKIDERDHAVSVLPAEADGTLRLVVDGRAVAVLPCGAPSGTLAAVVDGKKMLLHVARSPEGTWVWCAGRARQVRDADREVRRSAGRAGGGAGAVTPSFPSMVVAVLVAVGDVVRQGQPLVVISAMKMESRLVAPHAGTVRAIRTAVGASVKPGDVLVEIEPAAGGTGDG
jgi:biotin carboxyl carrier protein